jgi:hypothetical protein
MKKLFLMAVAVCLITACEKPITGIDDDIIKDELVDQAKEDVKKFTFTCKGEFSSPSMRGYLSADDNQMTDLWVYDYMDGECVQSVHQLNTDDGWGSPEMMLRYGTHHVYFVASRGAEPSVDDTSHIISWTKPSDTFWKDYEVTVVSTSNGNRAVTLDRMVTRLRVTIDDDIPSDMASLVVTPTTWYYGMNYTTGEPATMRTSENRTVSVPSSYIGTNGQLTANIFGFSRSSEWTTDVTLSAVTSSGGDLGSVTISLAPFKRNRVTEYHGNLFLQHTAVGVSVNDEWITPYSDVW